jgi:hypothetical protein
MKSDVILHALNEYLHIDGIAFYLEIAYCEVNADLIELDRQCCILLSRGAVELNNSYHSSTRGNKQDHEAHYSSARLDSKLAVGVLPDGFIDNKIVFCPASEAAARSVL